MWVAEGIDANEVGDVFMRTVSGFEATDSIVVFNGSLKTRLSSGSVFIRSSCSKGLLSSVILWLNAFICALDVYSGDVFLLSVA